MSFAKAQTGPKFIEEPVHKPSKLSIKQEVKRQRERDINRMSSWSIIWHLTYRHRVGLLICSNVTLIAYLIYARVGV